MEIFFNLASGLGALAGRIFDVLNTITWPVVALILAIYFRQSVRDISKALVNVSQRLRRFGDLELQEEQSETIGQPPHEAALADVLGDDPDLRAWAEDAERTLQQANVLQSETKARLIRAWAHANRARLLDRLARLIFQTQVDALRKIEQGPTDGRALRRFHSDHVRRATARGIPEDQIFNFQRWIEFLTSNELAIRGVNGYTITDRGRAFLQNADQTGLPDVNQL